MNVFVLNSGRCGSMSFVRACAHVTNFSCQHESKIDVVGENRLDYPDNHIEVDNRLSWFLGRLDASYGQDALYVHLKRNTADVVDSFERRQEFGIMRAYREGVYMDVSPEVDAKHLATDYLHTIEANIKLFLKDKQYIEINLETIDKDFTAFWRFIGAEGELEKALAEFQVNYNAS